jgi:hypothetical protein
MRLRAFIAVLALLTGGVLLWAITAGSNDEGPSERVTSAPEKKAVRVERRLAKDPSNEQLLLATMTAWIGAGSAWFEGNGSDRPIPASVAEDYEVGLRAWNRYLTQTGGEATTQNAEYAGAAFFSLVEIGSTDPAEAKANAAGAARALRIACRHERNLLNLSNLASFEYFNGEFAAGDRAAKEASEELPPAKGRNSFGSGDVLDQLSGYRERGEKFIARVKRGEKELEESGEEELETPIKGYGSAAGINGYEPE